MCTGEKTYIFLLQEGFDELRGINSHLFRQLIEAVFDLVLAFDALLLHLYLDVFQVLFLFLLQLGLLLCVLLLHSQCDLYLVLLFDLRVGLVLSLGVFFLELFDFVILLLLKLLEFLAGGIDDFFDAWVDHQLLHFEAHFRLEAEAAEFGLGLADGALVVLHGGRGLSPRTCHASIAHFVQELHDLRLVR